MKSDWVGLIDEWAGRFFQELDYEREAASAATFAAQMADLPGITTPDVRPDLSSHTVLTTAWVPGAPGPARARVSGCSWAVARACERLRPEHQRQAHARRVGTAVARRMALSVLGFRCAC